MDMSDEEAFRMQMVPGATCWPSAWDLFARAEWASNQHLGHLL